MSDPIPLPPSPIPATHQAVRVEDMWVARAGWYRLMIGPVPDGRCCYARVGLAERMGNSYAAGLAVGPGYAEQREFLVAMGPARLRVETHGVSVAVPVSVQRVGFLGGARRLAERVLHLLRRDPAGFAARLRARISYQLGEAWGGSIGLSTELPSTDYQSWLDLYDCRSERSGGAVVPSTAASGSGVVAVIVAAGSDGVAVNLTRTWLAAMTPVPSRFEILDFGTAHDSNAEGDAKIPGGLARLGQLSTSSRLLLIEAGVLPRRYAGSELTDELETAGALVAFGDYDHIDSAGRRSAPVFAARFDRFHSAAAGLCGGMALLEQDSLAGLPQTLPACQPNCIAAIVQMLAERHGESRICHAPLIVSHVSERVDPERLRARSYRPSKARRRQSAATPLLTLIIPSRDRVDLLSSAVRTLFLGPDDPRVELIVVDHNSVLPETMVYLSELSLRARARVLRVEGPFNFSRLVNRGAGAAMGEVLCLANDDIEAIDADWLEPLVAVAGEPDVGAVAPKLLYPDGCVQHAGVAVGVAGLAVHAGRLRPAGDPGPGRILHGTRSWSAVTAAFLLTPRRCFEHFGGFDERIAIEFGDTDYCLRLAEAGFRSVCVNDVRHLHRESQTRRRPARGPVFEQCARDRALFQHRWSARLARDPWYPPNLSRVGTDLGLGAPPLRRRPRGSSQ